MTDTDVQMMYMVASGLSYPEMAMRCGGISPYTLKSRVARLRQRLGARDRAHLVALAYRLGMLTEYPSSLHDEESNTRSISDG
jgi:DNA-binding CsgD family transcriptional regulator